MRTETKTIPSKIALTILLSLSSIAIAAIWIANYQLNSIRTADQMTVPEKGHLAGSCKEKAYKVENEAVISVWPAGEENVFAVSEKDIANLPIKEKRQLQENDYLIKIIDVTPEVKKSLSLGTKEKPAPIVIKGYMLRCENQMNLAAIDFQEGTFSNYLKSL